MADLQTALSQFQREAEGAARRLFGGAITIESERRYNFLRIRIRVNPNTFIELYTNAQNNRGSYALIHREQRIFGYDGVTKWHRHPLNNPQKHELCPKPRLERVLTEMKEIVDSIQNGD